MSGKNAPFLPNASAPKNVTLKKSSKKLPTDSEDYFSQTQSRTEQREDYAVVGKDYFKNRC